MMKHDEKNDKNFEKNLNESNEKLSESGKKNTENAKKNVENIEKNENNNSEKTENMKNLEIEKKLEEAAEYMSKFHQKNQELQKKSEEYREKYLQQLASIENIQKREAEERKKAATTAIIEFAKDVIRLYDSTQNALSMIQKKSEQDGFLMVQKELLSVLKKNYIYPIECVGEKLDPNFHMAIQKMPGDAETNIVLEERQKGFYYQKNDDTLLVRESLVVVQE